MQCGIFLNQQKYVSDLLQKSGLQGTRPVEPAIESNNKLTKENDGLFKHPDRYRKMASKLNYLCIMRPFLCEYDILFCCEYYNW